MFWQTSRHLLDLSRPHVMGIVNVTPDSFSDGGRILDARLAIAQCERMVADGADILDIGGESTRPGASPVDAQTERGRVLPVLRAALTLGVPVSLDSSSPPLMAEALDLGVDILNDVRSFRRPGAMERLAEHPRAGACVMHMRGEPQDMDTATRYEDVVAEIVTFLEARLQALEVAGVSRDRVVVDPGVGFAKRAEQNLELLRRQDELLKIGRPVLVGWSRKSALGRLTGRAAPERTAASIAAALLAVQRGAAVVRVHDVRETVDALAVWRASREAHVPLH